MDLEDERSPASRAKVDVVCLDDLHPRLYVGSKKSLKHPDCLRELGVTVVFVLNDSKMQFKKHDAIMYVCGLFWLVFPLNSLLHFPLHSPQFPSAQCLSPQFHITLSPPFPSIPLRPMFVCGLFWLVYPLNSILHFPLHSPPFPSAQSLTPLNSISNSPHDSPHDSPHVTGGGLAGLPCWTEPCTSHGRSREDRPLPRRVACGQGRGFGSADKGCPHSENRASL